MGCFGPWETMTVEPRAPVPHDTASLSIESLRSLIGVSVAFLRATNQNNEAVRIFLPPEIPGKILSSYRCPVAFHQLSVSGAVVGLSVSRDASSRQKTCHTYGHFCDYVAAGALAAGALVFIVTSNHRHHIHRRLCCL